jgi:Na+-transporting NADH:ubiquinone oxidoreductase subunit C
MSAAGESAVPKLESTRYTFAFAALVCVVCALLVAVSAVGLRERQEANAVLYRQKNVLYAAGLATPDGDLSERELQRIFDERIRVRLVDLATGALVASGTQDPKSYDQRKARNDPAASRAAPPNNAGVSRLPLLGTVYYVLKDNAVDLVVLPIEGVGMWGTLYGFLALEPDGNTVRGLTYYDQKETPGLGGEIGNPKWQAVWKGRRVYDEEWEPRIVVIKGSAGPPDKDPLHVDGLSGATITSNGVSRLTAFWMSGAGWRPFLKKLSKGEANP